MSDEVAETDSPARSAHASNAADHQFWYGTARSIQASASGTSALVEISIDLSLPVRVRLALTARMAPMDGLSMPRNLVAAARRDGREEWLETVPKTVRELGERWSLVVGEPFDPGGETSWVASTRSTSGTELVLKVAWRHTEAAQEADGLRAWDGNGAVRLHTLLPRMTILWHSFSNGVSLGPRCLLDLRRNRIRSLSACYADSG